MAASVPAAHDPDPMILLALQGPRAAPCTQVTRLGQELAAGALEAACEEGAPPSVAAVGMHCLQVRSHLVALTWGTHFEAAQAAFPLAGQAASSP